MTSQLMTSYRETNIAKKKNLSSIVTTDVKLASYLKKDSEFCFSFLWQEHCHRSPVHGYACMLASLYYFNKKFTAHFQPTFTFSSMNSNTKVGCERCSRLIKKTLVRRKSIVVVHFVRFEQTLHLVWVLLWPFSKSK